ncbi:MAG: imidazole glycerol phosphate synthase subunit HisH [Planctomycetota bacterium]|jgi:glutamine amidotransferase|nr:imidazole glycerol phosphate synthase subunit HisH [Planctomycetota bacterium]
MIAILDYRAGNLESVRSALAHVGAEPVVTDDPSVIARADRLVFPGVGSAAHCMRNIRERGFDRVLADALRAGRPTLAICIGQQLLFDRSDEDGGVAALGLLPGRVKRFVPLADDPSCKIPHMGWNRVQYLRPHPLLPSDRDGGDFYFVHSYFASPAWAGDPVEHEPEDETREPGVVYGATEYAGIAFASMVGKGPFFAAQFHPEKSAGDGLGILERFAGWDGSPC